MENSERVLAEQVSQPRQMDEAPEPAVSHENLTRGHQSNEGDLQEEEYARYTAIISSSDDAIISKNLDGIITSWNQAAEALLGYTAEQAIGQHITLIIPPELRQEEEEILAKLRQGIHIHHYETTRMRKDGTRINLSLSISPIKNRAGHIIGATKIARDITERIELEQRKDEFISMASHELKTSLTTLKGATQLLHKKLERKGMGEEFAPLLTRIIDQSDHLIRLVNELLDASKIQAGRLDAAEEPVDFPVLVRATADLLQASSPTHTLIVEGTHHAWITGDKDHLTQVVTNLITNAIKYSPQANRVALSITTSEQMVTLRVQDQGVGISKAQQKHVFERFYRAHGSADKHFPGLGMGLYISHAIVKQHRGEMRVESEEGKGSTFIVSLPLQMEQHGFD